MAVTVNDVLSGIVLAIQTLFPGVPVHVEDVDEEALTQNLSDPCFVVRLKESTLSKEMGSRYKRRHAFDLRYFAPMMEQRHAAAELLYEGLERIEVNGSIYHGRGMRHEIADVVLHFYVNVDFRVIRSQIASSKMAKLKQGGVLKYE